MKIEYRYEDEDKKFLNSMKKENNIYQKNCHEIQKIWLKIHSCKDELIKLYCKQANLENKEKSEWGICINDMTFIPEKLFDCSVGMIRKMRNNVNNPDGTCKTCPYFMSEEKIWDLYDRRLL